MKYLKFYKKFFEDGDSGGTATANASNTSGMGAVVAAQPGTLPGTFGTDGSGDIGFTFKKEKRKKGKPSEVSDLRDLEPAKNVKKIEESSISVEEKNLIFDCLLEIIDDGFKFEIIEDGFIDTSNKEVLISMHKIVYDVWVGNITINYKFNKNSITSSEVLTLRGSGSRLTEKELNLVKIVDDCSHRLINLLDYDKGEFSISYLVAGSAMPYNSEREINLNINISLIK
jgi:hypothetical protein